MTDQERAAMQQALEAWGRYLLGECPQWKLVERFDALRSALAQEQAEPIAWLQPKTVDGYSRPDLGYETCSKSDYGAFPVYTAPPRCPNCASLEAQNNELDRKLAELGQADLSRCPQCNGPADNGHDRSIPPNPYFCSKCMAEPVVGIIEPRIKGDSHQTLDDAMQQPRAMAQAYENGYKAGVAARDADHQQTLALQQRSYEREIQLDVEAERERCLRLIDEHVRAVDAEDLVRAIKEGKE